MDEVEKCFHVPVYLREGMMKRENKIIESTVSFLDIAPTILKFVTNETHEEHEGCNLLHLIYMTEDHSQESRQNDSNHCDDITRIFPHYSDVTHPIAITTSHNHRVVFDTIESKPFLQYSLACFPFIR